jgi:diguanylate cyclase (GGDEF)-like protein/PAS domain S-box-containing protein/putative nucleotidyltransferase with HDIG domain
MSNRGTAENDHMLNGTTQDAALLRLMLDSATIGIWMLDLGGGIRYCNKLLCNALGIAEARLVAAARYADVLPPRISESFTHSDRECYEQDKPHVSMLWLPFADGRDRLFEMTRIKLFSAEGNLLGLIGLAADITERRKTEDKLRLIFKVFEHMQEGVSINDENGNVLHVNAAFSRITGYARDELIGKNLRILQSGHQSAAFYQSMWQSVASAGHWSGELWNIRKSGELYAEWLSISAIRNEEGAVANYVGISSDITQFKQHEKQLDHIAHYDTLTGLPNRTLLNDRLKQATLQAAREKNMLAICYLDLDGFKLVNDTMGHAVGDEVLVKVAQRIQQTIRGGDTVARMGGDEFVVLLLGLERGDECSIALERLLSVIAEPIHIAGKDFMLGASIGVSLYPLDDEHADTLLRHADQAMYTAKQAGRNRFHIYDPALDHRARNQQDMLKRIREGLKENQFELYYQPKVDLRTRKMVGAEALIRWNHPKLGFLMPGRFLPAVENCELDIELGEWVIATAMKQMALWRETGLDLEVSINISAYHLGSSGFAEKLQQQLSRYPEMPAGRLQVEVLETSAFEDIGKVKLIIEQCVKMGVGFALDDFGTGYSSLSYLSTLPVNTLKIDRSFVRNLEANKGDHAIVAGIIALSRAFELKTVAEGIETQAHFDVLLAMDCQIGQGYFIARPMQAAALYDWSGSVASVRVERQSGVPAHMHKAIECLLALPAMPKIAQEILAINLATDEGDELLLKLATRDAAILARIISLANSPMFCTTRKVLSMKDASAVLGIKRIKMIALGIAMNTSLTRKPSGVLNAEKLWQHSMAVALAMEVIAKAMPRKMRPSEEKIYLAGLLHDIGYLVLDYVDPEKSDLFHARIAAENLPGTAIEAEMMEVSHGELGALLAERWGLEPDVVDVMRYHHLNDVSKEAQGQPLIAIANLAERLLQNFGIREAASCEIGREEWHALSIADEKVDEIIAAVLKCADEVAQAFG